MRDNSNIYTHLRAKLISYCMRKSGVKAVLESRQGQEGKGQLTGEFACTDTILRVAGWSNRCKWSYAYQMQTPPSLKVFSKVMQRFI